MSAALTVPQGIRSDHSIHMLARPCRIAVYRDEDGRIAAIEPLEADDKRRKLIEAAGRGIAAGRTIDESLMNALAFADLWRELSVLAQAAS